MNNCRIDDRVRWYQYVTSALDRRNISRTSWDYYGSFGIHTSERGNFNHDVNIDVVRAMGFTPPLQIPRPLEPLSDGFIIFDDYPNHRHVTAGSWGEADFSLYETNSYQGQFAIRWANASQYDAYHFSFDPSSMDFSALVEDGFIEFMMKTNVPVLFDIRFTNVESSTSLPWRMRYTFNNTMTAPNTNWQLIRIPLSMMSEHGAWAVRDSRWHPPRGEFNWQRVNRLEFVAEHDDLTGVEILFDSIRIGKN